MPEIKTGNAGNQAQGGRALSSQPVFHAQFPVGKQEYAEFGQAPYVWLIKFHLICLAVILLSFLMQAITEQNYLYCACVSGASALLCGSYDIQAERGSRLAYRRHMISEGKPGTIYFLNFCGYLVSATDTHTPVSYDYKSIVSIAESERFFLLFLPYRLYIPVEKAAKCGGSREEFLSYLFSKCPRCRSAVQKVKYKRQICLALAILFLAAFLLGFVLFVFDSVRKAAAYPKGEIEKMLLIALKLL